MNWVTTILVITGAFAFASLFAGNERKSYRDSKTESLVFPALIINAIIGLFIGGTAVFASITVPFIAAIAIGGFLILIMINAMLFDNDGAEKRFVGAFIIFIILLIPSGGNLLFASVNNAADFDDMITVTDGDLFENEIPDNMVRLVTEEYAEAIVRKNALGTFGSNREIAATSIVLRDGRLTWVCVIVSTNTFAENYVQGMVTVDANNASVTDIITAEDIDFDLAEGLFWTANIQWANYLNDANYMYTDAYPAWDDEGELVYVQTRTFIGVDLLERPAGPIVYHQDTHRIDVYDYIDEVPDWMPRAYSEDWLERQIDRWGDHRRGNTFDFWAGGFIWIPPSNDRLEMSEDVRYILNPDTMRLDAMVVAHPRTSEMACAGVFRGTHDEIFYHDMLDKAYVAGHPAIDNIVGNLPQPSQGYYDGAMPLLYPIDIDNETVQTWYCPIYFYRTDSGNEDVENIELHALAMIDARDQRVFHVQEVEGTYYGESLVEAAKAGFKAKFGVVEDGTPDTIGNETLVISDVLGKGDVLEMDMEIWR